MSTDIEVASQAVDEFLTCLEVLACVLQYRQADREWDVMEAALWGHYKGNAEAGTHGGQYDEDYNILDGIKPKRDYTDDEFEAALWQVSDLGVALLTDHLALAGAFGEYVTEREQVTEIVRPKLYVPGT